jgi:hypothetical protein
MNAMIGVAKERAVGKRRRERRESRRKEGGGKKRHTPQ